MSENSIVEVRTVHFTIDPALAAYLAWIDQEGREFDRDDYGVFAAGYRADRPSPPSDGARP